MHRIDTLRNRQVSELMYLFGWKDITVLMQLAKGASQDINSGQTLYMQHGGLQRAVAGMIAGVHLRERG
jgi:hypothetical protein